MSSKKNLIALLILTAAVCLAYFNSLPGEFIHDDESEIIDNPHIRSPRYIGKILTSPAWAFEYSDERAGVSNYYRPLQYLTYMGIYRFCGLNPAGYHLFKLFLHILTVILVFYMIGGYFANFRTAFTAALLFALHPIHTEAVTWISGITDAMVTPFILLALIMYLKAIPGRADESAAAMPPSPVRVVICYACSLACFFVGLFSKETAVILIPLIILYDLLFDRPRFRLRRVAAYFPYAGLFVVYLAFRINAIGSLKVAGCKYAELTRIQCLLNPIYLAACYPFKALLPIHQSAWYVFHPVLRIGDLRLILSAILLLGTIAYTIRLALVSRHSRRGALRPPYKGGAGWFPPDNVWPAKAYRKPELFFLLWFFITLSPVIVFFRQIGLNVFAERYFYLPGVGFCAWLALELDRIRRRHVYIVTVGIVALAYCILTIWRNEVWSSRMALWTATVKASPDGSIARNNLGVEYYKIKRYDEAEAEYRESIRFMYDNPTPHVNLAMIHQRNKRYGDALAECETALRIRPDYADAYATRGAIYMAMENYPAALAEYENALRVQPLSPIILVSLGQAYLKAGDPTRAEEKIREALRLKTENPEAHAALAALYEKRGDMEGARREFERALAFRPDFAEAHVNLGALFSREVNMDRAMRELHAALDADPESADAHYRMGVLHSTEGRFPEAVREYLAAIRCDDEHVEALSAMGALLGMAERYAEAEGLLKKAIAIKPNFADAHYNLGILYRKTGQQRKLAEQVEALKKLDPKLARESAERK